MGTELYSDSHPGDARWEQTATHAMTRVLVFAHVRLHREGLMLSLNTANVRVVACAPTAQEAIVAARRESADVAVVDLANGGLLGAGQIAAQLPDVSVVGISVSESEATLIAAAEAGVRGLIGPNAGVAELASMIESTRRGELACSPRTAALLQRRVWSLARNQVSDSTARLTSRELDVIRLIDVGMSNREIAHQLVIELSTVKNHLHNIFEKLEVHDRGAATVKVRTAGVLECHAMERWGDGVPRTPDVGE